MKFEGEVKSIKNIKNSTDKGVQIYCVVSVDCGGDESLTLRSKPETFAGLRVGSHLSVEAKNPQRTIGEAVKKKSGRVVTEETHEDADD